MNNLTAILAAVIVATPLWFLGYQWDRSIKVDELPSKCSWLGAAAGDGEQNRERLAKETFGEDFYKALAFCTALKGF